MANTIVDDNLVAERGAFTFPHKVREAAKARRNSFCVLPQLDYQSGGYC